MQLLRELEEEDRLAAEREAKKAKEAQKKKDKKKCVGRFQKRLTSQGAARGERSGQGQSGGRQVCRGGRCACGRRRPS